MNSFSPCFWPPPPNYLPVKQPGGVGAATFTICPPSVIPQGCSLSIKPSGLGELSAVSMSFNRNTVSFTVYGGVPGRVYTLNFITLDGNGNAYQALAFLPIDSTLAVDPPPVSPSSGFGPALTIGIGSLGNDGGVLVTTLDIFSSDGVGVPPGGVWSNGGVINFVEGFVPSTTPTPTFFGQITAQQLLAQGVFGLTTTTPTPKSLQLYLVGNEIFIA